MGAVGARGGVLVSGTGRLGSKLIVGWMDVADQKRQIREFFFLGYGTVSRLACVNIFFYY